MRVVWCVLAGIVAFVVIGRITAKALLHHAVAGGAIAEQVRMGAWTGGLFAGGACAVLVGIGVALATRPRRRSS